MNDQSYSVNHTTTNNPKTSQISFQNTNDPIRPIDPIPPIVIEETSVYCPICKMKKKYSVHICPDQLSHIEDANVIP